MRGFGTDATVMQLLGILIELRGEGAANAGIYSIDILGALELVAYLYFMRHIKLT